MALEKITNKSSYKNVILALDEKRESVDYKKGDDAVIYKWGGKYLLFPKQGDLYKDYAKYIKQEIHRPLYPNMYIPTDTKSLVDIVGSGNVWLLYTGLKKLDKKDFKNYKVNESLMTKKGDAVLIPMPKDVYCLVDKIDGKKLTDYKERLSYPKHLKSFSLEDIELPGDVYIFVE